MQYLTYEIVNGRRGDLYQVFVINSCPILIRQYIAPELLRLLADVAYRRTCAWFKTWKRLEA